MTNKNRYALLNSQGVVINLPIVGKIIERSPKIEADGLTVTFTEQQIDTTVLSVQDMIVPGDKYVDGKFVKANAAALHYAVVRNRDNVLMHFVEFPDVDATKVVPDFDEQAEIGDTWDGRKFVKPNQPEISTEEPRVI